MAMNELNDTLSVPRGAIESLPFSEPFWEASRKKRLKLQYCRESEAFQFFPRPISIATGRDTLEWREMEGKGEVYSFTLTYVGLKQFKGHEPYAVILARLDAGVDIVSNIVNCRREDLRVGLRIRPFWLPLDDGRHLLLFEPDRDR